MDRSAVACGDDPVSMFRNIPAGEADMALRERGDELGDLPDVVVDEACRLISDIDGEHGGEKGTDCSLSGIWLMLALFEAGPSGCRVVMAASVAANIVRREEIAIRL
jgi:hypothetical protein